MCAATPNLFLGNDIMFKAIRTIALVAATLAVPAISFAQSTDGLTRADVQSQLVNLEKAGYQPAAGDNTQYPANIQAAEAKVAAQSGSFTSVGGASMNGTSAAGAPMQKADCAGSSHFCNIYFGS
jgi:hypothetical protein